MRHLLHYLLEIMKLYNYNKNKYLNSNLYKFFLIFFLFFYENLIQFLLKKSKQVI
jgi:hypothetical protein